MAASPNPLQGSLFESEVNPLAADGDESKSLKFTSESLANEELQNDSYLRPRFKKAKKSEINHLDRLSIADIEEPKWAHHALPKIDELTTKYPPPFTAESTIKIGNAMIAAK